MVNTATEPMILVDADARSITVPDELKTIGVALDNVAETVVIKIPKTFDDVDLSTKQCIVNLSNAHGGYGVYQVKESTSDDKFIYAHWKITNEFSRYAGVAHFSVAFTDATGYFWSTTPAEMVFLDGIGDGDHVSAIDIKTSSDLVNAVQELSAQVGSLMSQVNYLADNVATIQNSVLSVPQILPVTGYTNTIDYHVGDRCIRNFILYECTEDVTAGEEFDVSKWKIVSLQPSCLADQLGSAISPIGYATTTLLSSNDPTSVFTKFSTTDSTLSQLNTNLSDMQVVIDVLKESDEYKLYVARHSAATARDAIQTLDLSIYPEEKVTSYTNYLNNTLQSKLDDYDANKDSYTIEQLNNFVTAVNTGLSFLGI